MSNDKKLCTLIASAPAYRDDTITNCLYTSGVGTNTKCMKCSANYIPTKDFKDCVRRY